MRVLLSDGSGLTARQVATQLAAAGHRVEVLTPDPLALTRFTRTVRRVHPVPPYGRDPLAWLDETVRVLARGGFDVLLSTQEQVAVLSRYPDRVTGLGVGLAVPPFEALKRVQDKVSATATLTRVGLPQPETVVVQGADQLRAVPPPVFVKTPIGTATTGVSYVGSVEELERLATRLDYRAGIVVQQPLSGPLLMIQAVYAHGRLLARHANVREREGVRGGASGKRGVDPPGLDAHLTALGEELGWHGALSLDAIRTVDGLRYIDVNPRLVEPGNAWRSGVDLVDTLLTVSKGGSPAPVAVGAVGVGTHQLLLAVLGAAADGRAAVLRELLAAARHAGPYRDSREELTPLRRDPLGALPVALAAAATLARPSAWRWFSTGAVTNYALTPQGWQRILDAPG